MRASPRRVTTLILLVTVGLLAGACGGEAPPAEDEASAVLTEAEAEAIVQESFPAAEVTVQALSREGDDLYRAPAEFMGSDVTFVFERAEATWELAAVEQGETSHTPDQLAEIAATVRTLRDVSDALEQYRQTHGELPALDDQVGLEELVPEFYPEDSPLSDVWGQPFRYRVQGGEYTLVSVGPDGELGTRDDLVIIDARLVPPGE